MISPSMSTAVLTGRVDNFIRISPTTGNQATTIANKILADGIKEAAVLYDSSNIPFTTEMYEAFAHYFRQAGGKISEVLVLEDSRELTSQARTLVSGDPECVLAIVSAIDLAMLAQQIRREGSPIKIYGVGWAKTPDLIQHGGRAVEGIILVGVFENPRKSSRYLAFEKSYTEKYGHPPSFIYEAGYEAASVLIEGMRMSRWMNPESVKRAILEKGRFDGLQEPIRFDRFGDVDRSYTLFSVQKGRFVVLDQDDG